TSRRRATRPNKGMTQKPAVSPRRALGASHHTDQRSGLRSAGYPGLMRLAVGDAVVYTRHGVGRVAGREQKLVLGLQRECVLLDLAGGLRVTLPIEQACERLGTIASKADLRRREQTVGDE